MQQDLNALIADGHLAHMTAGELRVYVVLLCRASGAGRVVITGSDLAGETGLNPRNVRRAVAQLKDKGLLEQQERSGKASVYLIGVRFLCIDLTQGAGALGQEPTPGASARGQELTPDAGAPPGRALAPGVGPSRVVVVLKQQQADLFQIAARWGVPQCTVDQWVTKHGWGRLQEAVQSVQIARNVRRPAAMLRRAVEAGWRPPDARVVQKAAARPVQMVFLRCETCAATSATQMDEKNGHDDLGKCAEPSRPGSDSSGDLWGPCGGQLVRA